MLWPTPQAELERLANERKKREEEKLRQEEQLKARQQLLLKAKRIAPEGMTGDIQNMTIEDFKAWETKTREEEAKKKRESRKKLMKKQKMTKLSFFV